MPIESDGPRHWSNLSSDDDEVAEAWANLSGDEVSEAWANLSGDEVAGLDSGPTDGAELAIARDSEAAPRDADSHGHFYRWHSHRQAVG